MKLWPRWADEYWHARGRKPARRYILLLEVLALENTRSRQCAAARTARPSFDHECAQCARSRVEGCANKKTLWPKPQGFVFLVQPLALGQRKA